MAAAASNLGGRSPHAVLVGGGLHNAVVALGLLDSAPDVRVTLLERGPTLGGNHTWCFHGGDIGGAELGWVGSLVCAAWPAYEVAFPARSRTLNGGYFMVSSARLHEVVSERFETEKSRARLQLSCEVKSVERERVRLADGRVIEADVVIDARGPSQLGADRPEHAPLIGYQKFVGLELRLEAATQRQLPLLMDARVPQTDGFRFMYALPLVGARLLLEDTYYADGPELDVSHITEEILAYASRAGLRVREVLRREKGVLPLPGRMRAAGGEAGPARIGYGAGFFHPTTGYSFPFAVRVAALARQYGATRAFGEPLRGLQSELRRQQRFACLLNRLLFRAIASEERYRVLERFYTLPAPTIERFYALQLETVDRARILCGRPPAGMSLRSAAWRGAFA